MKRWLRPVAFAAAAIVLVLTFINASWLADKPRGGIRLIAHRGVYQLYDHKGVDNDTCTAGRIEQPRGQIIDLMQALKASLAQSAPEEAPARRGPRRAPPVEEAAPVRAQAGSRRAARKK